MLQSVNTDMYTTLVFSPRRVHPHGCLKIFFLETTPQSYKDGPHKGFFKETFFFVRGSLQALMKRTNTAQTGLSLNADTIHD